MVEFGQDERAKRAIRLWEQRESVRGTWQVHWQDAANHMLPERADFIVKHTPGMKRMQYVYDATPIMALEQFAAGLHSLLTSPTLQWFNLLTDDDRLNSNSDVAKWLQATTRTMYSLFNSPRHNFASQSTEVYRDEGAFGTSVMAVLTSPKSGILFSTRHLNECMVGENDEDRIDSLVRKWTYTARQAFDAWGKAAGENVMKALSDDKPDQAFTFLHLVHPRMQRDAQRADRRHMEWESVYVNKDEGSVIDEGGFQEFPYLVPRFSKITGETYGRGPGLMCLPDIKMLNEMAKLIIKSAQKVIDPPLLVPDDGFMMTVKTTPGALNYYRSSSRAEIKPIETKGQVNLGIEMVNQLRMQIERGFFVEWMRLPSDPSNPASAGKGITATYVLQQRDEKMRLLSPMLARLQSEFLGPLIDRVFAIMWRQSKAKRFGPGAWLTPPPPALSGVPLRVEYVSPIAVAQRASQLEGVDRLVERALQLIQIDQQAGMILSAEGIMRLEQRSLNAPIEALRTPEELQQMRQQQAEAQAAMNNHTELANVASSAKDGTAALKNMAAAGINLNGAGAGAAPGQQMAAAA